MKDHDPKGQPRREDADDEIGLTEEERSAMRAARREALLDVPLDLRTRVQEDKRSKRRDAPKHKGRLIDDENAGGGRED